MGVGFNVLFKLSFSFEGFLNFLWRHRCLFNETVREDSSSSAMKEIQHSIIHMLQSDPKLINAITQKVGFRPPEFVAQFLKPLNPDRAFVERFSL
jgi:hypothetical protein